MVLITSTVISETNISHHIYFLSVIPDGHLFVGAMLVDILPCPREMNIYFSLSEYILHDLAFNFVTFLFCII